MATMGIISIILKTGLVSFFLRKILFTVILSTAYMVTNVQLEKYFDIQLHFSPMLAIWFFLVLSIFCSSFFSVGKVFLKQFLIMHVSFVLGVLLMKQFDVGSTIANQNILFNGTFFGAIILQVVLAFTFRKNRFILRSLKEVDNLGNGHAQEAGRLFEEYVAGLYCQLGFDAVTTTTLRQRGQLPPSIQKRGGSGEQGVDVIFYEPEIKGNVIVQCKHFSSKVGNSAIQEICAARPIYKGEKLIVVTNNYFTEPAKELAIANNVILIDRDELGKFIDYVSKLKQKKAS